MIGLHFFGRERVVSKSTTKVGTKVTSSQYLYRRPSGIYFVRLCVPARFKVAVGKGEIHRSTGCRDFRLAKIVAAELAAHWHRAILALQRMDIIKVKAGSIKLLGIGHIPLNEAAALLGSTPLALADQLHGRHARIYVQAVNWLGWQVADLDDACEREHDDFGRMTMVVDGIRLGLPFTHNWSSRYCPCRGRSPRTV